MSLSALRCLFACLSLLVACATIGCLGKSRRLDRVYVEPTITKALPEVDLSKPAIQVASQTVLKPEELLANQSKSDEFPPKVDLQPAVNNEPMLPSIPAIPAVPQETTEPPASQSVPLQMPKAMPSPIPVPTPAPYIPLNPTPAPSPVPAPMPGPAVPQALPPTLSTPKTLPPAATPKTLTMPQQQRSPTPPIHHGPHVRQLPSAYGYWLNLQPHEAPMERVVEMAKKIDSLMAENQVLVNRIRLLEARGIEREYALNETIRDSEEAAKEVARCTEEVKILRKEISDLKKRLASARAEEMITLQLVITELEKIVSSRAKP